MNNTFSKKDTVVIGLMMFALFLGAGNLIFPPALGQTAGTSVWSATLGFLVTGVGLPVLAIVAIAKSGGDLQKISERVSPLFAIIFPLAVYLSIGPLFGIPRTGSVAYEIGIMPYLSKEVTSIGMIIFTFLFFGTSYWLSLSPSKLVGRIGKILTPILVILLVILTIAGIFQPMGQPGDPTSAYKQYAFFTGFQEGYFTMDAIAALVFGIIVITRMNERGITATSETIKKSIQVGIIAGIGLSFVYYSLAFLGATSLNVVGYEENGGAILISISKQLLGPTGGILLSAVIMIACLTTSIGLISAFGEYIQRTMPKIPYWLTTGIIALFSFLMANMGLTQLIQFSLPMLFMIYPVAIVLIVLTLSEDLFHRNSGVFKGAVIGAAFVSIPDGLSQTETFGEVFNEFLSILPLSEMGIAWIIPSIIAAIIGGFLTSSK